MAKSAPRQNRLDTANFVPSIFIIGFLCVGFIPNWEAVDKIAPQWLYLSLLYLFSGSCGQVHAALSGICHA